MAEHPIPVFRTMEKVLLIGTMTIYNSQSEASEGIPRQWREFRKMHRSLSSDSDYRGASPCTGDGKIHYLSGVAQEKSDDSVGGEPLSLEAGEYAVVQVSDAALLRDTWVWLLRTWLPTCGRREKNAPEFEKYTDISETGFPIGPVEIWIPLELLTTS